MRRRGLVLVFAGAVALSVLALLPLRWAAAAVRGLAAADVSGSVWRGRLVAAQWQGLELGDVAVALEPGTLLSGRLVLRVEGVRVRGLVGTDGVSDLSGLVGFSGGELRLEGLALGFAEGVCVRTAGRVVFRAGGEILSAVPRCEGAGVALAMARADGVVVMNLLLGAGQLGTGQLGAGG